MEVVRNLRNAMLTSCNTNNQQKIIPEIVTCFGTVDFSWGHILTNFLLQKFISHFLSLLTFFTNTLFISMLYVFTEWRQWHENNFTAGRLQTHLPWKNARLYLILRYILLRQILYRGLMQCLFRKLIFRNNKLIILINYLLAPCFLYLLRNSEKLNTLVVSC